MTFLLFALHAGPISSATAQSPPEKPSVLEGFLRLFGRDRREAMPAEPPPVVLGPRRVLIICGHPGDAERRARFAETIETLNTALVERLGVQQEHVWLHFGVESMEEKGPTPAHSRGPATQQAIGETLTELKQTLKPEDALWVIVMGHSFFNGRRSQFNLPGPDLDQEEFGRLFEGIACREMVFWITIPASGFYIRPLSAKGRIIITATEADREINETEFPHALAETLANLPSEDSAGLRPPLASGPSTDPAQEAAVTDPPPMPSFDADADGRPTLLDLYVAVCRNVMQRYADENALPTEHALLDDNGDGRGTELQIDYLPEELGGRGTSSPGSSPVSRSETLDGAQAAAVVLSISPKPTPPE
ncbi:MAG: hypothetical protein ACREJB_12170 [Planctomycetaceae bacterium]